MSLILDSPGLITAPHIPTVTALREAAMAYWSTAGWPVRVAGQSVVVAMGDGMVGVAIPAGPGEEVLTTLRGWGADGPVLRYPDRHPWLVFVVEQDDQVSWHGLLPGLSIVDGPRDLALPPTVTPAGPVEWATKMGSTLFEARMVASAAVSVSH